MSELERVSVTIERDLLAQFDRLTEASGHQNRSEAVRDLIRNRLAEEDLANENGKAVVAVSLFYDHTQRELPDRLLETGHHHHHVTLSTLHVHLDEFNCLEVVVLKGRTREVRRVALHLIGMKGVKHGKVALVSVSA